jgi:hypothetical protein
MAMLRLYGRRYCHLCEEMALALRARGLAFEEYDVDADEGLEARYGDRVPVLTDAAGVEICFGRLDEPALNAVLAVR